MIANATETVTVTLYERKMTVTAVFDYYSGFTGDEWIPPEPAEVEIKSLKDEYGLDVDFVNMNDNDYYRLSDALIEKFNERKMEEER